MIYWYIIQNNKSVGVFGNFEMTGTLTHRSHICLYSCNEKCFMFLLFYDIPLVAWRPSKSVWSSTPLQLPATGTENSCRMKKKGDGKIKHDIDTSDSITLGIGQCDEIIYICNSSDNWKIAVELSEFYPIRIKCGKYFCFETFDLFCCQTNCLSYLYLIWVIWLIPTNHLQLSLKNNDFVYLYATYSSHLICLHMQVLEALHYEHYKNGPVANLYLTDGKTEHYHWIKTLDFQRTYCETIV